MWILPKQLHTSAFVPDTAALSLDSTELSEICARSLFVRSKPSPARTWSQKWKRDSWTQHLSGRILNPSHGQSFVTAWTSSLGAIPASHSAQPESGSAQKTLGTSGLSSQTEFDFFAPDSAISRMSKDTSPSDSERSLESWNKLVIQRRGEYSARLKSAHRTRESASLSWPTISVNESKNSVGKSQEHRNSIPLGTMAMMIAEGHASFVATNSTTNCLENTDAQTARVKDAANWPTPAVMDTTGGSYKTEWIDGRAVSYHNHKEENPVAYGAKLSDAVKHGQAAPANPSTDGSRQESWATPRAGCPGSRAPGTGGKVLEEQVKGGNWATPQAHDAQGPKTPEQIEAMRAKGHGVKNLNEQACWGTPTARDHKSGRGNEEWEYKELTPMVERTQTGKLNPRWVETLMGLPIGWVMPSCASPVTIEPTNCDSSATESCLPQPRELFEF